MVEHPRGIVAPGVPLGPLLMTGLGDGVGESARLAWRRPEQLSKVIVTRLEPFDIALELTGRRCGDAGALRFADGQPWPTDATLPWDEIERRTSTSFLVGPQPSAFAQSTGERAEVRYFVFSGSGRWLIEAKAGDRVVAIAVVDVGSSGAR